MKDILSVVYIYRSIYTYRLDMYVRMDICVSQIYGKKQTDLEEPVTLPAKASATPASQSASTRLSPKSKLESLYLHVLWPLHIPQRPRSEP